ncbi:MAG TPA: DNA polymerase III subunit delta' [Dissulfurispiraceae bacterium]|nr:DNA polymerase III subunit delta' [Dissulfurispiraceae bacterium]
MALNDVVGQERALRILFGMLKRDRVPSALLFSGDAGIGKRLAAVNYAKAINCLEPAAFDCCDTCISCRKIEAAAHPDVTLTFPEKDEIKIDAVRRLEERLFLKALEGRKKIAIIDDADTMNINAANAFLKTLEEPPGDSLVVLVSSNPYGLPDTIRSRCISIRFYPLSHESFRKAVSGVVAQEHIDSAGNWSMGRPGLALAGDFVKNMEWFTGLLENMVHEETKEAWADKEAIKIWLDMAFIFLRDLMIFKITGKESDQLYAKGNRTFCKKADLNEILDTYKSLQKLRGVLDFNLNKSITWNYVSHIMRTVLGHG